MKHYLKHKLENRSSRKRKDKSIKPNGRSTDFIIPSFQIGCEISCAYCYTSRYRAFGNPVETYTNQTELKAAVLSHYSKLPSTKVPNQTDPTMWTYDIGESTDCLGPGTTHLTNDWLELFQTKMPKAKASFATKLPANWNRLITVNRNSARVRVSLMPQHVADLVEKGSNSIEKRIDSVNCLYEKGYEVHINLSPVVIHAGWLDHYAQLLNQLKNGVSKTVLDQIKYEVIFLTHHPTAHSVNLTWNPEGEQLLWIPEIQEQKKEDGTVRYNRFIKNTFKKQLTAVITAVTPQCQIRYIF